MLPNNKIQFPKLAGSIHPGRTTEGQIRGVTRWAQHEPYRFEVDNSMSKYCYKPESGGHIRIPMVQTIASEHKMQKRTLRPWEIEKSEPLIEPEVIERYFRRLKNKTIKFGSYKQTITSKEALLCAVTDCTQYLARQGYFYKVISNDNYDNAIINFMNGHPLIHAREVARIRARGNSVNLKGKLHTNPKGFFHLLAHILSQHTVLCKTQLLESLKDLSNGYTPQMLGSSWNLIKTCYNKLKFGMIGAAAGWRAMETVGKATTAMSTALSTIKSLVLGPLKWIYDMVVKEILPFLKRYAPHITLGVMHLVMYFIIYQLYTKDYISQPVMITLVLFTTLITCTVYGFTASLIVDLVKYIKFHTLDKDTDTANFTPLDVAYMGFAKPTQPVDVSIEKAAETVFTHFTENPDDVVTLVDLCTNEPPLPKTEENEYNAEMSAGVFTFVGAMMATMIFGSLPSFASANGIAHISKMNTCLNLFKNLQGVTGKSIPDLKPFINSLYSWFFGKDLFSKDPISEKYDEYLNKIGELKILGGHVSKYHKDKTLATRVQSLYIAMRAYENTIVRCSMLSATEKNQWTRALADLQTEYDLALTYMKQKKERNTPLWIHLMGAPGVGKTRLTTFLAHDIKCLVTDNKFTMNDIYARRNEAYWSGYTQQFCTVIDDIWQAEDPMMRMQASMDIINCVNTAQMSLEMADLASKGNTFFESELIVSSSNEIGLPHDLGIRDPGAIQRRCHVPVTVLPRKEGRVRKPKTKTEWARNWILRVHKSFLDKSDNNDEYVDMGYHDFVKRCLEKYDDLQEDSASLMAAVENTNFQMEYGDVVRPNTYAARHTPVPITLRQRRTTVDTEPTCDLDEAYNYVKDPSKPHPNAPAPAEDDPEFEKWEWDSDSNAYKPEMHLERRVPWARLIWMAEYGYVLGELTINGPRSIKEAYMYDRTEDNRALAQRLFDEQVPHTHSAWRVRQNFMDDAIMGPVNRFPAATEMWFNFQWYYDRNVRDWDALWEANAYQGQMFEKLWTWKAPPQTFRQWLVSIGINDRYIKDQTAQRAFAFNIPVSGESLILHKHREEFKNFWLYKYLTDSVAIRIVNELNTNLLEQIVDLQQTGLDRTFATSPVYEHPSREEKEEDSEHLVMCLYALRLMTPQERASMITPREVPYKLQPTDVDVMEFTVSEHPCYLAWYPYELFSENTMNLNKARSIVEEEKRKKHRKIAIAIVSVAVLVLAAALISVKMFSYFKSKENETDPQSFDSKLAAQNKIATKQRMNRRQLTALSSATFRGQMGADHTMLSHKIITNLVDSKIVHKDGVSTNVHQLFLTGTIAVAPKHAFLTSTSPLDRIDIRSDNREGGGTHFASNEFEVKHFDNMDIVLIKYSNKMQPFKDLTKYMPEKYDNRLRGEHPIRVHQEITGTRTSVSFMVGSIIESIHPDEDYHTYVLVNGKKTPVYCDQGFKVSNCLSTDGDCSLPYIVPGHMEKGKNKPLVAIHVGGKGTGNALAMPLYKEMLDVFEGYKGEMCAGEWSDELLKEFFDFDKMDNVDVFGTQPYYPLKQPPFMPKETAIVKSPFQRTLTGRNGKKLPPPYEVKKKPAIMSPTLVETGDGGPFPNQTVLISPYKQTLNNYQKVYAPTLPPEVYRYLFEENMFDGVLTGNNAKRTFRKLTKEEAILGKPDCGLGAIPMNTSMGWPFTSKGLADPTKVFKISEDRQTYTEHPFFTRIFDETMAILERGEIPPNYVLDTLKDECKSFVTEYAGQPLKDPQPKLPRLFDAGSKVSLVIGRMLLGDLVQAIEHSHLDGPIKVGMNPHSREWRHMRNRHRFNNLYKALGICAGDCGQYDKSLILLLAYVVARWCCRMYAVEFNSVHGRMIFAYIVSVMTSIHISPLGTYQATQGNSSGCYITSILNSLCNMLIHRLIWKIVSQPEYRNRFREFLMESYYGDDSVVSVRDEAMGWFTMFAIRDLMKDLFSMRYTDPDKGEVRREFIPEEEVVFLSRTFRYDADADDVFGALEPTSIENSVLWMNKKKNTKTQLDEFHFTCKQAMMEWFYHGKQVYEKNRLIMNERLQALDSRYWIQTTWEDQLQIWQQRKY